MFFLCSLREKVEFILRATFQHARNLALLATSYKVLCFLQRRATGRQHPLQNFISAAISGYFVFGENNKINMQVRGAGRGGAGQDREIVSV